MARLKPSIGPSKSRAFINGAYFAQCSRISYTLRRAQCLAPRIPSLLKALAQQAIIYSKPALGFLAKIFFNFQWLQIINVVKVKSEATGVEPATPFGATAFEAVS